MDDVIAALTRLPKKGRAIGLISHVDELKNRVPVKLNVEAAQMGQGSRVSIEIN